MYLSILYDCVYRKVHRCPAVRKGKVLWRGDPQVPSTRREKPCSSVRQNRKCCFPLPYMFLEFGREPECPDKTHAGACRISKLHTWRPLQRDADMLTRRPPSQKHLLLYITKNKFSKAHVHVNIFPQMELNTFIGFFPNGLKCVSLILYMYIHSVTCWKGLQNSIFEVLNWNLFGGHSTLLVFFQLYCVCYRGGNVFSSPKSLNASAAL